MKTYFVARAKSLGEAYDLLNELSQLDFELFEIAPVAGGAHLILFSALTKTECDQKILNLKSKIEKQCEYAKTVMLSDDVIESYLSLRETPLKDDLLIIEHDFLGNIFERAQQLHSQGFDLLDLRFAKGFKQRAHAFFTNIESNLAQSGTNPPQSYQEFVQELRLQKFEVTYLAKLSDGVRALFEHASSDNSQSGS